MGPKQPKKTNKESQHIEKYAAPSYHSASGPDLKTLPKPGSLLACHPQKGANGAPINVKAILKRGQEKAPVQTAPPDNKLVGILTRKQSLIAVQQQQGTKDKVPEKDAGQAVELEPNDQRSKVESHIWSLLGIKKG